LVTNGIGVLVGVGTGVLVGVGVGALIGVGTGMLVGVGAGMLVGVGTGVLVGVGTAVFAGVGDPFSPNCSATLPSRFAASSFNPVSPQAAPERTETTRINVIEGTRENAINAATWLSSDFPEKNISTDPLPLHRLSAQDGMIWLKTPVISLAVYLITLESWLDRAIHI
jgi:hypothetical protein